MPSGIVAVLGTGVGIILAMGALILALFLHSNSEMKYFYGRLVAIETDFKNFMKKEEEKRTQIILDRRN